MDLQTSRAQIRRICDTKEYRIIPRAFTQFLNRDQKLDIWSRHIWITLYQEAYFNPEMSVQVSANDLAFELNCSKTAILSKLAQLEETGYIVREKQKNARGYYVPTKIYISFPSESLTKIQQMPDRRRAGAMEHINSSDIPAPLALPPNTEALEDKATEPDSRKKIYSKPLSTGVVHNTDRGLSAENTTNSIIQPVISVSKETETKIIATNACAQDLSKSCSVFSEDKNQHEIENLQIELNNLLAKEKQLQAAYDIDSITKTHLIRSKISSLQSTLKILKNQRSFKNKKPSQSQRIEKTSVESSNQFWEREPLAISPRGLDVIDDFISSLSDRYDKSDLKQQILYSVARKFTGAEKTEKHTLNIAFKLIKEERWSCPKGYVSPVMTNYERYLDAWNKQKNMECRARRYGAIKNAGELCEEQYNPLA
jgi:biotin operon repressor